MEVGNFLEKAVKTESHSSVDDMKNLLIKEIEEGKEDPSGCIVAQKGSGKPHVIFNTHMDTVPPPLPFKRDNGIIRGRGSCDAKASLTAMVYAFINSNPNHKLTLVVSPDEETESEGIYRFLNQRSIDGEMAIIGEPTSLDICNSARGRFEFIVEIVGEGAHAATGGTNSVNCAAEAIKSIDKIKGTTITNLEAGEARNRVPEKAKLLIDTRGHISSDQFLKKIKRSIQHIKCSTNVNLIERPAPFLEAFETPKDEKIIKLLSKSMESINISHNVRSFKAATEASYFSSYMPTVVFGPGDIEVAHSKHEKIKIDEVKKAGKILLSFLRTPKNH